jgi:hypothetical protein
MTLNTPSASSVSTEPLSLSNYTQFLGPSVITPPPILRYLTPEPPAEEPAITPEPPAEGPTVITIQQLSQLSYRERVRAYIYAELGLTSLEIARRMRRYK